MRFQNILTVFLLLAILIGCSSTQDIPEEVKKAFQLAAGGKVKEAATLLQTAEKKHPKNALYPFYLGKLYSRHFNDLMKSKIKFLSFKKIPHKPFGQHGIQKNPDGSIAEYQVKDTTPTINYFLKAINLDPKLTEAYIEAASLYAIMFQVEKAHNILKKGMAIIPDDYSFLYYRGFLFRHIGQYSNAMAMYKAAEKIAPEESNIHLALGTLLLKLNRPIQADNYLGKVIQNSEKKKDKLEALQAIFLFYYLKGLKGEKNGFKKAVAIGSKYLSTLKKYPKMMIRHGKAAYLSGLFTIAYTSLKTALAELPIDAQALTFLGEIEEKRGELTNALNTYQRALAIKDRFHTRYMLGSLLLKMNKPKQAMPHLQRAARIKKDPLILYTLAKALTAANADPAKRKAIWKQFLKVTVSTKFSRAKITEAQTELNKIK